MKYINTILLLLLFTWGLSAQSGTYIATLSGGQEVPPVETEASGQVTIELEDSTIIVSGSFKGLESDFNASIAGGAHLHIAYAGSNGGVAIPINASVDSTLRSGNFEADSNRFMLSGDQLNALQERRMYVNIHTVDQATGELRGQVLPAAQAHYFLPLSGEAEVPPVNTNAIGALTVEMYDSTFIVTGSFSGMSSEVDTNIAGGAHLHQGGPNENGPVIFPINPSLDSGLMSGNFSAEGNMYDLSSDQKTLFALGQFYANIHTRNHPSGELRGQLNALTTQKFHAYLSGRQEVLPIASWGSGQTSLDLIGDRLIVSGSFKGLSTPVNTNIAGGAHLHIGYAGQNGPVSIPLDISLAGAGQEGSFEADSNVYVLDSNQMAALQERRMYVNIHSFFFPSGELRGQVLPEANAYYFVNLMGSNEVSPVMTNASGATAIEVYDDRMVLSGSFQNLESDLATQIAGGAHLHTGMAGMNGPVAIALNATEGMDSRSGVFAAADNSFSIGNEEVARLENRQYYVNIHSNDQPAGEIRGQIASAASQIAFRAYLSGANEVPAVISRGEGQVIAEMSDSTLRVHGRFDGLEDPVATSIAGGLHIHVGFAGQNGPVQFPLTTNLDMDSLGGTLMASENVYSLDADQTLISGLRGLYINVHSTAHQGGEIRGQLLPESQIVFDGQLSGTFEVPNALTPGWGGLKAEMNGSRVVVSGSFQNLSTNVDTNIAGGAHLHLGLAGSTGPVNFGLSPSFPSNVLRSGFFLPLINRVQLDSAQITHMRSRHYYANIHTERYPSGELRAQLLPEANYYMVATLSGAEEVLPMGLTENSMPVNTDAQGMAILEVRDELVTTTGSFNDLSSPVDTSILGGAHLHTSLAGSNGPIAFPLDLMLRDGGLSGRLEARYNVDTFRAGQLDTLRERMFYVNVHTENFAPGEIRGQVLGLARAYFTANLSGINEVQPVASGGSGTIEAEYTGSNLIVTGSFNEMTAEFNEDVAGGAHLHLGSPAENGNVDIFLNASVNDDSLSGSFRMMNNTFDLNSGQLTNLFNGNYYVNIHSDLFPGGELRGQLLESINYFPMDAPVINTPADGDSIILEGEVTNIATIGWDDSAIDENEVVYLWQLALDSNFNNVLAILNVGQSTEISFTYGTLDTLLNNLGVDEGQTANVYHRVLASDGSVVTNGEGAKASIKRALSTSIRDLFNQKADFTVSPTVTQGQVRIAAESPEAVNSEIHIRNAMGQLVDRIPATSQGQRFEDQYIFRGQPQGMYLIQWIVEGEPVATERVLLK